MTQPRPKVDDQPQLTETPARPLARPTGAIISTVLIVALTLGVVLGFNALASRLGQSGGQPSGVSQPTGDQGVYLGGAPAPSFSLKDQTGGAVTLDSLKGKPTIFTFFDSVCPHTDCSLMAQYVNATAKDMDAGAGGVNWVALSLNPWHDTPRSAATFLSNQKMVPHVTYLLGSPDQLQPLWDAFHMQSILQSDGIVIHTTGVYLLDSQTHEQVFMNEGFNPATLSADVALLLKDGPSAFAGKQSAPATRSVSLTHSVSGMLVTLTATPGAYGSYNFTVQLKTSAGEPISNAAVALDLGMPDMAMSPVHVDMKAVQPGGSGVYRADGVLSMRGVWVGRVSVTPQGATAPATTSFTFTASY